MRDNLHFAVGRLVRCCQWAAVFVFAVCAVIVVREALFFEPIGRALMIVVAVIPPALFLIGLYFYEEQYFRIHEPHWIASVAVFVLLASPAILMNWRYSFLFKNYVGYFLTVAGVLFTATSAMPARTEEIQEGFLLDLVLHYKRVMMDTWVQKIAVVDQVPTQRLRLLIDRGREPFYSQAVDDLLAFQQTLSCPEQDAAIMAQYLFQTLKKKTALSVIDVGGAEGRFTANLLCALQALGCTFRSVLNVDPAPRLHERYQGNITGLIRLPSAQIYHEGRGIEDAVLPACDLLLASHSLYAMVDKSRAHGDGALDGQIQKLLQALQPGGAMIVIMSSEHSLAIGAKRQIYQLLFGSHCFDTVAEMLDPVLTRLARVEKRLTSDTLIDLTMIVRSYEEHGVISAEFVQWASYFLRFNLKTLPSRHLRAVIELFIAHSFRLRELPESLQSAGLGISRLGLHPESRVLPHKAFIYVLRPAGKNI